MQQFWETTRNIIEFFGFILLGALVLAFLFCCAVLFFAAYGIYAGCVHLLNWMFPIVPPDEMKKIQVEWDEFEWTASGYTETGFYVEATGRSARVALFRLAAKVDNLKRDINLR